MILTIQVLRQTGRVGPHPTELGHYIIEPPIELICREDGVYHRGESVAFKKGDTVQVNGFFDDVREASYPGMVHLHGIRFNWPMDIFEVKEV